MRVIQIYIYDTAKKQLADKLLQENEDLGFEKNKVSKADLQASYNLVDFFFDEKQLTGFWLDPGRDDDTKTVDIIIYIGGLSFRTPHSKQKVEQLTELLNINR